MPDETNNQPDVTLEAEKTGTQGITFTHTQADVDKAVRDARTAVLVDIGRSQAASAKAIKVAQDAQERLNHMIAEQDRRELEDAEGDPQRLSALQERQGRRRVESENAQLMQQLAQKDELIQQHEKEKASNELEKTVQVVATRFAVDPLRLANLAKYTDGSLVAIEDLAKELPANTAKPPLRPDPNRGSGGGTQNLAQLVKVDTRGMSIDQLEEHRKAILAGMKTASIS